LARAACRGYSPAAWRSGVRLCRRATGQGISRPTVYRWCIGPRGKENLGAVCGSSGHRSHALENAPASRRRRLLSTVRSPFRYDGIALRSWAIQVAQTPIGDSLARSMKIRERSKNEAGSFKSRGLRQGGSSRVGGTPLRTQNAIVLTKTSWPPARRPSPRPPIPGGTRCRFSTCLRASPTARGRHCAAPASP
jgi:hypothetical protein